MSANESIKEWEACVKAAIDNAVNSIENETGLVVSMVSIHPYINQDSKWSFVPKFKLEAKSDEQG